MKNLKIYTTFLLIFILTIIIGSVVIISSRSKQENVSTQPTSDSQISVEFQPTPPPIQYDKQQAQKLIDILEKRPPLSNSDQVARDKLIQSLANKSGVLQKTDKYIIEYVKAPDEFMAEILTTDLKTAKQEAVEWFVSQGISQKGVCNLPLVFYLNRNTAEQLRGTQELFSPLPENC